MGLVAEWVGHVSRGVGHVSRGVGHVSRVGGACEQSGWGILVESVRWEHDRSLGKQMNRLKVK